MCISLEHILVGSEEMRKDFWGLFSKKNNKRGNYYDSFLFVPISFSVLSHSAGAGENWVETW